MIRNRINIGIAQLTWYIAGISLYVFGMSILLFDSLNPFAIDSEEIVIFLLAIWPLFSLTGLMIVNLIVRFPRVNWMAAHIVGILISQGALLLFVAIFRFYYSRPFIIFGSLFLMIWVLLGYYLLILPGRIELMLIEDTISKKLKEIRRPFIKWIEVSTPEEVNSYLSGRLHYRGIVSNLYGLTPEWKIFLEEMKLQGVPIYHSVYLFENFTGRIPADSPTEHLLMNLNLPVGYLIIKRFFEILLILISLPLILPLVIITSVLIKIDSPGKVFFPQERVGFQGKIFRMLKFRSMTENNEEDSFSFASKQDERTTRIGRIIRKLHIDELPQFWNVLVGDMSLIGPRPEQIGFTEKYNKVIPAYKYRNIIRPGITGWAQVNSGYADTTDTNRLKLEYDLFYVNKISLWLDLLIIFKTIKILLTTEGAR